MKCYKEKIQIVDSSVQGWPMAWERSFLLHKGVVHGLMALGFMALFSVILGLSLVNSKQPQLKPLGP